MAPGGWHRDWISSVLGVHFSGAVPPKQGNRFESAERAGNFRHRRMAANAGVQQRVADTAAWRDAGKKVRRFALSLDAPGAAAFDERLHFFPREAVEIAWHRML